MKSMSFSEDSVWRISDKIQDMIDEGKIKEVISMSISTTMVAYSVHAYCILIYK